MLRQAQAQNGRLLRSSTLTWRRMASVGTDAEPFLEPVDVKGLGIPDYPSVVKKPMDLGTVAAGLQVPDTFILEFSDCFWVSRHPG